MKRPADVDTQVEAVEKRSRPLTWEEWATAARYSALAFETAAVSHLRAARKAWREGMSPAEYRKRANRGEL